MSENIRDRLVRRYYVPPLRVVNTLRKLDDDPTCPLPPPGYVPISSEDPALTAFAQLTAIRLKARRSMISLIDSKFEYILAEATRTLSLQCDAKFDDDDQMVLGSLTMPRSRGIGEHIFTIDMSSGTEGEIGHNTSALVIKDMEIDPRFSSRARSKTQMWTKFYAAVPLATANGTCIGALCVLDDEARMDLDEMSLAFMRDMSITIMRYLETCKVRDDHRQAEQMLRGLGSFVEGMSDLKAYENEGQTVQDASAEKAALRSRARVVPMDPVGLPSTERDDQIAAAGLTLRDQDQAPGSGMQKDLVLSDGLPRDASERNAQFSPSAAIQAEKQANPSTSPTKTSVKLLAQESLLPAGSKKLFSRAANIIQQSCHFHGVLFLDASVSAFSASDASSQQQQDRSTSSLRRKTSTTSISTSATSGDDSGSGPVSNTERSSHSQKQMCPVLGFAEEYTSSSKGDEAALSYLTFSGRDLRSILRKHPKGKLFSLDGTGALSPWDISGSEASGGLEPGVKEPPSPPERASRVKRPGKIRYLSAVKDLRQGMQSLAVLPLWDFEKERWSSVCFAWTTSNSRPLSARSSLAFLRLFGNSIMNGLSRLDAAVADRAKTTFISSISHELRSPLHGILGGAEFLQDTVVDTFQHDMISSIEICGRTLLDTINNVLDFAKINNFTHMKPSRRRSRTSHHALTKNHKRQSAKVASSLTADVDLSLITEEVVEAVLAGHIFGKLSSKMDDFREQTDERDMQSMSDSGHESVDEPRRKMVRVTLDIPKRSNWTFKTQPGALRRILMNLFGNALKYTDRGNINVSLSCPEPEDEQESQRPRQHVVLTVVDTGRGISREYLQHRLFKPFSQEDPFAPGTGLGLSIVRQLVESMGGSIDIKSQPGMGTSVKVSLMLPKTDPNTVTASELPSTFARAVSDSKGKSICILDSAVSLSVDGTAGILKKSHAKYIASIESVLGQWLNMDVSSSKTFSPGVADVFLCPEPSFTHLTSMQSTSTSSDVPRLIFVCLDALEAVTLRADARIHRTSAIVEIVTQPCGPRKLARAVRNCLKRSEIVSSSSNPLLPPTLLAAANGPVSKSDETLFELPVSLTPTPAAEDVSDPLSKLAIASPVPEPQKPRRSTRSVLIVDDNAINLRLLSTFMKKHNYDYEEATNGLQAVKAYKRARGGFDYILMDLSMPVMDGMSATREIRKYEEEEKMDRNATVIALTGLASASAQVEALNSGVNHFLTKPVRFKDLIKIVI